MQSWRDGSFATVGRKSCSRSQERFAFDAGRVMRIEAAWSNDVCVQTKGAKSTLKNQIDIS